MTKKGNQPQGGEAGDLLIKIVVRPHPYFRREGADIYSDKYISVTQAILGGTVNVETLSGKKEIKLRPGTAHGEKIRMEGFGVHKLPPNQNEKGAHIVNIKISIPTTLTPAQRQALEAYAKVEDKPLD